MYIFHLCKKHLVQEMNDYEEMKTILIAIEFCEIISEHVFNHPIQGSLYQYPEKFNVSLRFFGDCLLGPFSLPGTFFTGHIFLIQC